MTRTSNAGGTTTSMTNGDGSMERDTGGTSQMGFSTHVSELSMDRHHDLYGAPGLHKAPPIAPD